MITFYEANAEIFDSFVRIGCSAVGRLSPRLLVIMTARYTWYC